MKYLRVLHENVSPAKVRDTIRNNTEGNEDDDEHILLSVFKFFSFK